MPMNTLHELFLHELKDMYDAEHQLLDALPALAEAASMPDLAKALRDHHAQTQEHVVRLEQVFESLDEEPARQKCDGMKGLIHEGQKILEQKGEPVVKDAAMIAACNKVEHYEIAGYGTLVSMAELMGHEEAVDLLQQTLEEEEEADELLTEIAEGTVNPAAPVGHE